MSGPAESHHGAGRFAPPYEPGSLADHLARCGSSDWGYYTFAELLEAALTKLHDQRLHDVISVEERHALGLLLVAAHDAAQKHLPQHYPRDRIGRGFWGAIRLVAVWATPSADRGSFGTSAEVWRLWLRMFLADVENMNRAARVSTLPDPVVMSDLSGPAAGGDNVVSFPPRFT